MYLQGTEPIDNTEDVIDSRDVIARIAYLENATNVECTCERTETLTTHKDGCPVPDGVDEDEVTELATLRELASDGEVNAADWHHGATLVRETYFEDYARQFAEDIGTIDSDAAWPACHIDWPAAARALSQDYTDLDFNGVTYLVRS